MNTNFRLGEDVALALAGAQLGRLRRISKGIIERLLHREEWASMMIALMPDLPRVMHQQFFTSHWFDFHQRNFVLSYNADEETWILNFAKKPDENPPQCGDAQGVQEETEQERARREQPEPQRRRRPPRAAFEALEQRWREIAERVLGDFEVVRTELDEARDLAERVLEAVCAQADALRIKAHEVADRVALHVRLAHRRQREQVDAVLSQLKREFESAVAQEAQDSTHLETRSIVIAGGVSVDVSTMAPDRIDWDSFPFGRMLSQEEQALA
jgi:hypothetical protein